MRSLNLCEARTVSAGANSLNIFSSITAAGESIKNYFKTEILFGAVGLALLCSPAGWGMTVAGTIVGAFAGLGYGYIKENLN